MTYGKTVRIHLASGNAQGIRHGEITNWTGQAIAFPRARFSELKIWEQASRTGVYFLFSPKGEDATAYIGEAEDVLTRLSHHLRHKSFWEEAVIFTSKDENLTKAHVKYLESSLLKIADEAGRYSLKNGKRSEIPTLPLADRDAMSEFIDLMKLLLTTLGYPILETESPDLDNTSTNPIIGQELYFKVRNVVARGMQKDSGFMVLEGSQFSKSDRPSAGKGPLAWREKAMGTLLQEQQGALKLTKDTLFSSSSFAASCVAGTSRSGPDSWQNTQGKTLKKMELESAEEFES